MVGGIVAISQWYDIQKRPLLDKKILLYNELNGNSDTYFSYCSHHRW
jgi:hypothetical protein